MLGNVDGMRNDLRPPKLVRSGVIADFLCVPTWNNRSGDREKIIRGPGAAIPMVCDKWKIKNVNQQHKSARGSSISKC